MKYEKPKLELLQLEEADVITLSVGDENLTIDGIEGGEY